MSDVSSDYLRGEAARDRHLARVERLLTRQGVPLSVVDRVAGLVNVPVGADDEAIGAGITALRREVPGVFVVSAGVAAAEDGAGAHGKREAERRFGIRAK